jgi:dTDP-4-amino-4,6-dideoxygalactose transaminase
MVSDHFMAVPFLDARLQDGALREEIKAAVSSALECGPLGAARIVDGFETRAAAEFESRHAVAVGSGGDSLAIGLAAHGIGAGDAVLLPALAGPGTVAAVRRSGAIPVLVDIVAATALLDLSAVEEAVDRARGTSGVRRVAALLVVHLFGKAHDLPACREVAARHDLKLFEEASAAACARSAGARVGTASACGAVDLSALAGGVTGGGLLLVDDDATAQRLRERCDSAGSRLAPLAAAVLERCLPRLETEARQRFVLAHRYLAALGGRRLLDRFVPLEFGEVGEHVFQRFVVRVARREALRSHLAALGIGSAVDYPRPLHLDPDSGAPVAPRGAFPEAERAAASLLALPAWPGMARAQVDAVISALAEFGRSEAEGG